MIFLKSNQAFKFFCSNSWSVWLIDNGTQVVLRERRQEILKEKSIVAKLYTIDINFLL